MGQEDPFELIFYLSLFFNKKLVGAIVEEKSSFQKKSDPGIMNF